MNLILGGILSTVLLSSIPYTTEYTATYDDDIANVVILEQTIQEKIELKAKEYGLNPELMLKIAEAESQFRNVPNYLYKGEDGKYTAYGIFQITRPTWKHFCGEDNSLEQRSNIDKNIECAMIIASESGVHHWNESKLAWS